MAKNFTSNLEGIDPLLKAEILEHLEKHSPMETARRYHEQLGLKELSLYRTLLRKEKRKKRKEKENPLGLDEKARDLVEKFRMGQIGFDEVHTEIGARALEQILSGESNIKMQDFLRATTVKMKKDQDERAKDAMEEFIDTLFSGFVSAPTCPHCGNSTLISKEQYAKIHRREHNKLV